MTLISGAPNMSSLSITLHMEQGKHWIMQIGLPHPPALEAPQRLPTAFMGKPMLLRMAVNALHDLALDISLPHFLLSLVCSQEQ